MKASHVLVCLIVTFCATTSVHAAPDATAAGPPANRTNATIAFMPDVQDFYTQESRSLGEQGVVRVRICYDAHGNITSNDVEQSSGIQRLDAAAIQVSRRILLRPGTLDGVPEAGCMVTPMTFSLDDPGTTSDKPAEYLYRPDISDFYPPKSKSDGEEGLVEVRICYNMMGKFRHAEVVRSSGFRRLDRAAVRAGKKFRFSPGSAGGVPLADCALVPINFSLRRDDPGSPSDKPAEYLYVPDINRFYPAYSKAMGEEGLVEIRICYNKKGKVVRSPVTTESSLLKHLDLAAMRAGRKFRFSPRIVGGVPQAGCVLVQISFSPDGSKAF